MDKVPGVAFYHLIISFSVNNHPKKVIYTMSVALNTPLAAFEVKIDYTVKHQKEFEHGRYITTAQS